MKKAIRPAIFKWRQTEPKLIYCAVRWYLRYSLSFRDVEERLRERGLEVDHTTIWRWVQRYGPDLEGRLRRQRKPTNTSWRVEALLHEWGRASWAGCGPDVRRGGQTLIMGYSADKSPLIGHLAGPLRRLEPLVAQRQEKCGPNRPTPTGYSCNNATQRQQ